MKRRTETSVLYGGKRHQYDQWDIRHCEGLTKLLDMLTIRTACMYEYLRKNIRDPEVNITGNMLTVPVLLSFMFTSRLDTRNLFKESFDNYYRDIDTDKKGKYKKLMNDLLLVNFGWNNEMTQEAYRLLYNGLQTQYIHGNEYFNMFLLSMELVRIENWKLRYDNYIEDGSVDSHPDRARKLEFYVDWDEGMVKKVTDKRQRYRTTTPGLPTSYFSVVYGSINIFKIIGKHKMTGLLDQDAGIYERFFVNQPYNGDNWRDFEKGGLIPTKEIFITFPWFEISLSNVYNTRFTGSVEIDIDGQKYVIWKALYNSVQNWYVNSFSKIDNIEKYQNNNNPGTAIYIAGHSLGGAQANVAALLLYLNGYRNVHFYGFGSPRIGGEKLSALMDNLFANSDSMNVMNIRYIYSGRHFWVEYDPVTKYPNLPEYSRNGRVFAIESGFIFKPVFGTYNNQPGYDFGKITGAAHSLLPINDRCGKHWDNIHTGKSVLPSVIDGKREMVTWINGQPKVPVNTVIDLNIYACFGVLPFKPGPLSVVPGVTGQIVKRSSPDQCGIFERVGGWIRHCTYNFPVVKRAWETYRNPIQTNYDKLMLAKQKEILQKSTVIDLDQKSIIILPKGEDFYKSMTVGDLRTLNARKLTWYGSLATANKYKEYFGPIFAFKTTKPLKLLALNNVNSIEWLIRMFDKYENNKNVISTRVWINGENHNINVKPSYLLRITVGYGVSCADVEEFRKAFISRTGFRAQDLPYVPSVCKKLTEKREPLQRFSIYEIDQTVYKNMCNIFEIEKVQLGDKQIKLDGYFMKAMPSAFGVFISNERYEFPFEILLCEPDGIKHDPENRADYSSRTRLIQPKKKHHTPKRFSILSFNVHFYQDTSMKNIASVIKTANPSPDVICIQEDVVNVEPGKPTLKDYLKPQYKMARRCVGQYLSNDWIETGYTAAPGEHVKTAYANLGNTIYVKNDIEIEFAWDFELSNKMVIDRNYTPRCVSLVTIGGITIANVHLTGGQHEDPYYKSNLDIKAEQLSEIVKRFQPDVICGDFNGEFTPERALIQLKTNPVYKREIQNGRSLNKKTEQFLRYQNGWSNLFRRPEDETFFYKPAYTEEDVKETSIFHGVPDWVLYKPQYLTKKDVQQLVGYDKRNPNKPGKPILSDHDGILVTFEDVPEISGKPKRSHKTIHKIQTRGMLSGPITRGQRKLMGEAHYSGLKHNKQKAFVSKPQPMSDDKEESKYMDAREERRMRRAERMVDVP